ncbi:hypothetical protein [Streptomyces atratus]|uniref:hypothetical protein n=1 Tax=Streptomyces atratus TaxID=1893 RepID=UPI00224FB5B9|nr:hypothetical protein [Streptomyces atratus]MCX5344656.1 hypothetical protein [Streptomyces atratus]
MSRPPTRRSTSSEVRAPLPLPPRLLPRRLRGIPLAPDTDGTTHDETGRLLFSLGRPGLPVNALRTLTG